MLESHRKRCRAAIGGITVAALALTAVASAASPGGAASAPPGADMEGTGPQPKGLGVGSKAALAQETCNENGRTSFVYVGTGPWCVNPWEEGADNGGATAPGVTATEVKVVVYQPNEAMIAEQRDAGGQVPTNQASKDTVTLEAAYRDFVQPYEHAIDTFGTYQLWGRRPVYEFVTATGSDEASQRADALEVIARKPFMVYDGSSAVTGAEVFAATVAARKILVSSASTNSDNAAKQRPYRWIPGQDPDAGAYLTASFLGRSLAGEKAKWAGDDAMTSRTRSFGAVYPSTGLEIAVFEQLLKDNGGGTLADAVEYDDSDSTKFQEAAPTLLSRLKAAGVTTVVLFAEPTMVRALMAAATSQDYAPEWIITGYLFHDFDGFGRTNDQEQMSHAFGIGVLPPTYEGSESSTGVYQWYWGTQQGNYTAAISGGVGFVYSAIQYAGPKLTAKNVEKGLFSLPSTGGASDGTTNFQSGYGKTVGLPYDEYALLGTDRNLAWWNAELTGPANAVASLVGKGKFMYLNGAKRYGYGDYPKKQPKYFVESASVAEIPRSSSFADGVVPPDNPCGPTCPVNGGSGAA
jgi:hypothetical protein